MHKLHPWFSSGKQFANCCFAYWEVVNEIDFEQALKLIKYNFHPRDTPVAGNPPEGAPDVMAQGIRGARREEGILLVNKTNLGDREPRTVTFDSRKVKMAPFAETVTTCN